MFDRRTFLQSIAGSGLALGASGLLPAWAKPASDGNTGLPALTGDVFNLSIGKFPARVGGRLREAIGVNGTLPAPLIRFREDQEVTLNVTNTLDEDTSIHWHGLLVPFQMDGVPGVSYPGIRPGETFQYKFSLPHNGTYWYHSHSGLQEQLGHYGPLIIDPKGADPVQYDREYVLVLGDWTFADPYRVFARLKKASDSYNYNQRTVPDFFKDASEEGLRKAFRERAMWGGMRMSPRDLADIGGAAYTYIINGHSTADNWNGVFVPGERVRLRIINAAAMSMFNIRIPGLPMTIVNQDGLNVEPLEIDEFQMGVAETYDVIIEPKDSRAYAFVAESIDRSGQVVATFGPRAGMRAEEPAIRPVPTLTMRDMGMDHSSMAGDKSGGDMSGHDMGDMGGMGGKMDHGDHKMDSMDHGSMDKASVVKRGPGVANIAASPMSRLDEPGIGLDDVPHRTLRYTQLRSLEPNPDTRPPSREIELHLTSNMERYMWSFNGVRFADVKEPIKMREGERVRMILINDTMMPHPIHLHGMFFDLENGQGNHLPRKHTVIVKPGERLSYLVSADHVGDWAFHCHLFFHMHAGMMQVVSILPDDGKMKGMDHKAHKMDKMDHGKMAHEKMDHKKMDHGDHKKDKAEMDHKGHKMDDMDMTGKGGMK